MSLILHNTSRVLQTDQTTGVIAEPSGSQDGDLQVILQTADIGGMDIPAGWQNALAVSGGVNLDIWWGIRGVHFSGGSISLSGNSVGYGTILSRWRITGNVDDTIEFVVNDRSWTDGDRDYFYSDILPITGAENRARLLCSFGGQEKITEDWLSMTAQGSGFQNAFYRNAWEASPDGGVSHGVTWSEDNSAIYTQVPANRFYGFQPPLASQRVNMSNFYILEALKKQSDILTPPPTF